MSIGILITGGTIDKEYDKIHGELVLTRSQISDMLETARCRLEIEIQYCMLKDSLNMDMNDRKLILEHCRSLEQERIVVTHGTDTIVETASLLGTSALDKTIVLFGAMIPYNFGNSDALFNLGTALAAVQSLEAGVYITMNGLILPWDNARKNRELGEFEFKKAT